MNSLLPVKILRSMKILMCPPTHFDIEYEINPWMHMDIQPSGMTAQQQWDALVGIYRTKMNWEVETINPVKGLPDMVFATDSCLMIDNRVFLSSFRYPERQSESKHYETWFRDNGYTDIKQCSSFFEGGGDVMMFGDKIIAGYGYRSTLESHKEMADFFDREVISLKITDPNFYHLDTQLAVLNDDTVAYYPGGIDEESRNLLKQEVPNLIEATLEEANGFGLNSVSDGKTIVTSDKSPSLCNRYRNEGFEVIETPITEFQKSGGGVKCLTLKLR